MKIFNVHGDKMILTKKRLTLRYEYNDPFEKWVLHTLYLEDIARTLRDKSLLVTVHTLYSTWGSPRPISRLFVRKRRIIGCQKFDRKNWDLIVKAAKKIKLEY